MTVEEIKQIKVGLEQELEDLKKWVLEQNETHNKKFSKDISQAEKEMLIIPKGSCKYCTLQCDTSGLRCNKFHQHYNQSILEIEGDFKSISDRIYKINPKYYDKITNEIGNLNNQIFKLKSKVYENSEF